MEPFLCVTLFFLLLRLRRPGGEIVEEMVETVLYTRLCVRERRLSACCFFFPFRVMDEALCGVAIGRRRPHNTFNTFSFMFLLVVFFTEPARTNENKLLLSFQVRCRRNGRFSPLRRRRHLLYSFPRQALKNRKLRVNVFVGRQDTMT